MKGMPSVSSLLMAVGITLLAQLVASSETEAWLSRGTSTGLAAAGEGLEAGLEAQIESLQTERARLLALQEEAEAEEQQRRRGSEEMSAHGGVVISVGEGGDSDARFMQQVKAEEDEQERRRAGGKEEELSLEAVHVAGAGEGEGESAAFGGSSRLARFMSEGMDLESEADAEVDADAEAEDVPKQRRKPAKKAAAAAKAAATAVAKAAAPSPQAAKPKAPAPVAAPSPAAAPAVAAAKPPPSHAHAEDLKRQRAAAIAKQAEAEVAKRAAEEARANRPITLEHPSSARAPADVARVEAAATRICAAADEKEKFLRFLFEHSAELAARQAQKAVHDQLSRAREAYTKAVNASHAREQERLAEAAKAEQKAVQVAKKKEEADVKAAKDRLALIKDAVATAKKMAVTKKATDLAAAAGELKAALRSESEDMRQKTEARKAVLHDDEASAREILAKATQQRDEDLQAIRAGATAYATRVKEVSKAVEALETQLRELYTRETKAALEGHQLMLETSKKLKEAENVGKAAAAAIAGAAKAAGGAIAGAAKAVAGAVANAASAPRFAQAGVESSSSSSSSSSSESDSDIDAVRAQVERSLNAQLKQLDLQGLDEASASSSFLEMDMDMEAEAESEADAYTDADAESSFFPFAGSSAPNSDSALLSSDRMDREAAQALQRMGAAPTTAYSYDPSLLSGATRGNSALASAAAASSGYGIPGTYMGLSSSAPGPAATAATASLKGPLFGEEDIALGVMPPMLEAPGAGNNNAAARVAAAMAKAALPDHQPSVTKDRHRTSAGDGPLLRDLTATPPIFTGSKSVDGSRPGAGVIASKSVFVKVDEPAMAAAHAQAQSLLFGKDQAKAKSATLYDPATAMREGASFASQAHKALRSLKRQLAKVEAYMSDLERHSSEGEAIMREREAVLQQAEQERQATLKRKQELRKIDGELAKLKVKCLDDGSFVTDGSSCASGVAGKRGADAKDFADGGPVDKAIQAEFKAADPAMDPRISTPEEIELAKRVKAYRAAKAKAQLKAADIKATILAYEQGLKKVEEKASEIQLLAAAVNKLAPQLQLARQALKAQQASIDAKVRDGQAAAARINSTFVRVSALVKARLDADVAAEKDAEKAYKDALTLAQMTEKAKEDKISADYDLRTKRGDSHAQARIAEEEANYNKVVAQAAEARRAAENAAAKVRAAARADAVAKRISELRSASFVMSSEAASAVEGERSKLKDVKGEMVRNLRLLHDAVSKRKETDKEASGKRLQAAKSLYGNYLVMMKTAAKLKRGGRLYKDYLRAAEWASGMALRIVKGGGSVLALPTDPLGVYDELTMASTPATAANANATAANANATAPAPAAAAAAKAPAKPVAAPAAKAAAKAATAPAAAPKAAAKAAAAPAKPANPRFAEEESLEHEQSASEEVSSEDAGVDAELSELQAMLGSSFDDMAAAAESGDASAAADEGALSAVARAGAKLEQAAAAAAAFASSTSSSSSSSLLETDHQRGLRSKRQHNNNGESDVLDQFLPSESSHARLLLDLEETEEESEEEPDAEAASFVELSGDEPAPVAPATQRLSFASARRAPRFAQRHESASSAAESAILALAEGGASLDARELERLLMASTGGRFEDSTPVEHEDTSAIPVGDHIYSPEEEKALRQQQQEGEDARFAAADESDKPADSHAEAKPDSHAAAAAEHKDNKEHEPEHKDSKDKDAKDNHADAKPADKEHKDSKKGNGDEKKDSKDGKDGSKKQSKLGKVASKLKAKVKGALKGKGGKDKSKSKDDPLAEVSRRPSPAPQHEQEHDKKGKDDSKAKSDGKDKKKDKDAKPSKGASPHPADDKDKKSSLRGGDKKSKDADKAGKDAKDSKDSKKDKDLKKDVKADDAKHPAAAPANATKKDDGKKAAPKDDSTAKPSKAAVKAAGKAKDQAEVIEGSSLAASLKRKLQKRAAGSGKAGRKPLDLLDDPSILPPLELPTFPTSDMPGSSSSKSKRGSSRRPTITAAVPKEILAIPHDAPAAEKVKIASSYYLASASRMQQVAQLLEDAIRGVAKVYGKSKAKHAALTKAYFDARKESSRLLTGACRKEFDALLSIEAHAVSSAAEMDGALEAFSAHVAQEEREAKGDAKVPAGSGDGSTVRDPSVFTLAEITGMKDMPGANRAVPIKQGAEKVLSSIAEAVVTRVRSQSLQEQQAKAQVSNLKAIAALANAQAAGERSKLAATRVATAGDGPKPPADPKAAKATAKPVDAKKAAKPAAAKAPAGDKPVAAAAAKQQPAKDAKDSKQAEAAAKPAETAAAKAQQAPAAKEAAPAPAQDAKKA